MSFLTGKLMPTQGTDPAALGLKGSLISGLEGVDPLTGLSRYGPTVPPAYESLFRKELQPVLAQATESAGSLTGSGWANILGEAAGRSTSGFLLDLLQQRAGRASGLTSQMLQPLQLGYQPGFLDYLFEGLSAASPLLAGGGAKK